MSRRKFNARQEKLPNSSAPQKPEAATLNVLERSVQRSGLSYDSFVRLIIQSALSRLSIWTQAELDRLLLLAERLGLDPLNNEIYATEVTPESGKKPRIVYVVGVDGWGKVINSHPQFDGMKFVESAPGDDGLPLYIECTIYRKDRRVATSVREYMQEAHTSQGAWLTHPRRMLRHKAMVQCARTCFGLGGLYEPGEAERVKSSILSEANNNASKTNPISTNQAGTGKARPLGAGVLKDWIQRSGKAGRHDSQLNEAK
jgi:phage recombination protein Bet